MSEVTKRVQKITEDQHYVPRFYMKQFSNVVNMGKKNEKAFISFYQFKDHLVKSEIPTKSVASEKFFYGKDGNVEKWLTLKEAKWSQFIAQINKNEHAITSDEIFALKEFAAYQMCRTKTMLDFTQGCFTKMLSGHISNNVHSISAEEIELLTKERVEKEITSERNLEIAESFLTATEDLKVDILRNRTDTAFITSDAPVIIVNPLARNRGGLADIGSFVFFPISQYNMAVLYDEKLYGNIATDIWLQESINAFNKYQYICAEERILAKNATEFNILLNDSEIQSNREKFRNMVGAKVSHEKRGTFIAIAGRSPRYYFNILNLKLPKQLKRIPEQFRNTCERIYSDETRLGLLCRIYRDPDFIQDDDIKKAWKEEQYFTKDLLSFFDYYWDTPMSKRSISPELMYKLKTVPVNEIKMNKKSNEL